MDYLCCHSADQAPSVQVCTMANSTESGEIMCSRCHCLGHSAKDGCMFFAKTLAERRAEARAEAAKKRAEWEARQEERAKKLAEWEAKQAAWKAKEDKREAQRAVRRRSKTDLDEESNATDVSTAASITCVGVDESEVERLALLDKDVRKWAKVLREIEKLEGRSDLDELQKAKILRRHDVEVDLDSAKGLAKVRARDQLRRQVRA